MSKRCKILLLLAGLVLALGFALPLGVTAQGLLLGQPFTRVLLGVVCGAVALACGAQSVSKRP
jgi:hypothetical protein